jgi:predicted nucleic acid-binding protein
LSPILKSQRKKGGLLLDADLVIGAAVMSNNITLKTKDRRFERLKDFKLALAKLSEE